MSRIITDYCLQDDSGWNLLPNILKPRENESSCGFIRVVDGIHLMASIKDYGVIQCIHVSLAPIRALRKDWTDEDHSGHIFDVAYEIIKSFFGDKQFMRAPDTLSHPHVKHYFYNF